MIFDKDDDSQAVTDDLGEEEKEEDQNQDKDEEEQEESEEPASVEDTSDEKDSSADSESREISKSKAIVIREILRNIQSNLDQVFKLLGDENLPDISFLTEKGGERGDESAAKVVEGVFDGQNMIGPDGKQYTIPANYASKSKLVEGDILKLSITQKGDFIYKQIGPIERSRLIGTLAKNKETDDWFVLVNNQKYKVLSASVTYFKGDAGDEAVILVPKDSDSNWAAVENIIKKQNEATI